MAAKKQARAKQAEKFIWTPYSMDGYLDFGDESYGSIKDVMDAISDSSMYSPEPGEVIEVYQLVKTLRPKKQKIEFEEVK